MYIPRGSIDRVFVRPAQTTWNDPVFSDVQLRYVKVHLQVDLDEFGVADFVLIVLDFVCCLYLLAIFCALLWF